SCYAHDKGIPRCYWVLRTRRVPTRVSLARALTLAANPFISINHLDHRLLHSDIGTGAWQTRTALPGSRTPWLPLSQQGPLFFLHKTSLPLAAIHSELRSDYQWRKHRSILKPDTRPSPQRRIGCSHIPAIEGQSSRAR